MVEMFFMTKNRNGAECDSVGGVYFTSNRSTEESLVREAIQGQTLSITARSWK